MARPQVEHEGETWEMDEDRSWHIVHRGPACVDCGETEDLPDPDEYPDRKYDGAIRCHDCLTGWFDACSCGWFCERCVGPIR